MGRYSASEIGRQLHEARDAHGLSVAAAAKVMKVSREMVYKYEDGKSLPALDVLIRAANAWSTSFKLEGCEVIPEEFRRRKSEKPQPIQTALPFNRPQRYRKASVEIRRRDHEIVITAVVRTGSQKS